MMAPTITTPIVMSIRPVQQSPPKRPRLSLQTKSASVAQVIGRSVSMLKIGVDPSSPTTFNTLSNAYAAAIENSSPKTARPGLPEQDPKTAINTARPMSLKLQTPSNLSMSCVYTNFSQRTQTPGPFSIAYPDTPTSAHTVSSVATGRLEIHEPALRTYTYTPPQSAHPPNEGVTTVFAFRSPACDRSLPNSPRALRRRATIGHLPAPYTHTRSLHSILRNSPLPPLSTASPIGKQQAPLSKHCVAKRVGYNDPLTQTIITNKYIKSHIDLLAEDVTPVSPANAELEGIEGLDLAMSVAENETRDGGQTPGPFEEMRRRMAGLAAESNIETPASKKRKRGEKKRRWVWTIGGSLEGQGDNEPEAETPITAFCSTNGGQDNFDALRQPIPLGRMSDVQGDVERPGTSCSL